MTRISQSLIMLTLLALAANGASAESKFCKEKRAECEAACGGKNGMRFDCRSKGGAQSVSCSCNASAVKFGSGVRVEKVGLSAAPPPWWPTWFAPPNPPARAPSAHPLPLADLDRLAGLEAEASPTRTVGLALAAGALTLVIIAAAAGLVALVAKFACKHPPPRRPAGAAYGPTGGVPAHAGLDLEVGEEPDAVPLKKGEV